MVFVSVIWVFTRKLKPDRGRTSAMLTLRGTHFAFFLSFLNPLSVLWLMGILSLNKKIKKILSIVCAISWILWFCKSLFNHSQFKKTSDLISHTFLCFFYIEFVKKSVLFWILKLNMEQRTWETMIKLLYNNFECFFICNRERVS